MARCAVAALVLLTLSWSAHAQERQMGGIGLTVFSDSNYHGRNATFREDTPMLGPYGLDDRISSLQVGPGEIWEVCEFPNYGGRCQIFSGAQTDLKRVGWSDIISSVRRMRSPGNAGYPPGGIYPPGQPPVVGVGLELFSNTRFQGERRMVTSEVPDLRRIDFNDRASSLRLGQSEPWEVCVEANYRGCRVVNTDWPDLSGLAMNERISSVRPWSQGGVVQPPPQFDPGRIVLYDDRSFRGKSFVIVDARPVLTGFQDKAESVQVFNGVWELCDRPDFGGRCVKVTSNVSDLGSLGLRNRVSSARPVQAY